MADRLNKEQRSKMMSRVKNRDTQIETVVRSLLHQRGFRFRKNVDTLPGRPDIVLSRYNVAIFVHGCFWHGHLNCNKGKLPSTRIEFWSKKIDSNKERDRRNQTQLINLGWRIGIIWECAFKNATKRIETIDQLCNWIKSEQIYLEIPTNSRNE